MRWRIPCSIYGEPPQNITCSSIFATPYVHGRRDLCVEERHGQKELAIAARKQQRQRAAFARAGIETAPQARVGTGIAPATFGNRSRDEHLRRDLHVPWRRRLVSRRRIKGRVAAGLDELEAERGGYQDARLPALSRAWWRPRPGLRRLAGSGT